ncbi:MAG: hypothetical protein VYA84_10675 [Planctomycetota bacterium]|nr:hypothetical protein [Planctomycetota bacterium]
MPACRLTQALFLDRPSEPECGRTVALTLFDQSDFTSGLRHQLKSVNAVRQRTIVDYNDMSLSSESMPG